MEPVCLSASLPDAVMRTHHFRSEVIYLARNFKVRSCSLYLSTYCCGLLLMKSHSKLFILHERCDVLFHFLLFFPSTKCELFTRVTLSGLLVCVISRAIGYLQKSSAYGMCQTDLSLSRKQPQAPLLTALSICAELVGFATAELLLSCFAASPHLRLAPCQGSCPLGLAAAAGDPRRIQTTSLLGRHLIL